MSQTIEEERRKYERERKAKYRLKKKTEMEAIKKDEEKKKPKVKVSNIKVNDKIISRPVIAKKDIKLDTVDIKPKKTVILADNTIKAYLSSLRVVIRFYGIEVPEIIVSNVKLMLEQKDYDIKTLEFYFKFIENDPELLLKKIYDYNKSIHNLIKFVTVLSSRIRTLSNTYKIFSIKNLDEINKYKKNRDNNTKPDDKIDIIKEDIYDDDKKDDDIKKSKKNKDVIFDTTYETYKKNLEKLENCNEILIFSLYLLTPPRRLEYNKMNILYKIEDNNDNKKNYYDIINSTFIFNVYKTVKTYKQQIIDIPNELNDIIVNWIKCNNYPEEFPFINTTVLNRIFKKTYNIDGISVDNIRKSFLTNLNDNGILSKMTELQRKTLAYSMAHSREEQNTYIKV
jgi:hypothetical protein